MKQIEIRERTINNIVTKTHEIEPILVELR